MGLVHLVRHGNHSEVGHILSGRSDIALDDLGLHQAQALVARMEGVALSSVYSSPRRRAQQTAAPLAQARNFAVHTATALDEIDFGAFTGLAFDALDGRPDWQAWNARRSTARCPGGETMGEAVTRAVDFIFTLADAQAPALCVTHCDIIRGVVAHVLGLSGDRIFMLDCAPASITTLSIERGAVRLVTLNSCAPPRS